MVEQATTQAARALQLVTQTAAQVLRAGVEHPDSCDVCHVVRRSMYARCLFLELVAEVRALEGGPAHATIESTPLLLESFALDDEISPGAGCLAEENDCRARRPPRGRRNAISRRRASSAPPEHSICAESSLLHVGYEGEAPCAENMCAVRRSKSGFVTASANTSRFKSCSPQRLRRPPKTKLTKQALKSLSHDALELAAPCHDEISAEGQHAIHPTKSVWAETRSHPPDKIAVGTLSPEPVDSTTASSASSPTAALAAVKADAPVVEGDPSPQLEIMLAIEEVVSAEIDCTSGNGAIAHDHLSPLSLSAESGIDTAVMSTPLARSGNSRTLKTFDFVVGSPMVTIAQARQTTPSSRPRANSCPELSDSLPLIAPSRLEAATRAFLACDSAGAGVVGVADLARWWAAAAEQRTGKPLTAAEKRLIAADVQLFFERADVFGLGEIDLDAWMHSALIDAHPPEPSALAAIVRGLRRLDDRDGIGRIMRPWLTIDDEGTGLVCGGTLAACLRNEGDWVLSEMLAKQLGDLSRRVSYAEYCALQCGLESVPVELHYYDISKSFAKYLAPVLLGRSEEGVWHTSVVVFGREFYYYGGILMAQPGTTDFGKPTKILQLGRTLRTLPEFRAHIASELQYKYKAETYDAFKNNCNHVCDDIAMFLLDRHVPDQVRFLSERLMKTNIARLLRPLLNRWLGRSGDDTSLQRNRNNSREVNSSNGRYSSASSSDGGQSGTERVDAHEASIRHLICERSSVLYDHPGSSAPVVAQVTAVRDDGAMDLLWLDRSGRRRVSSNVRASHIQPYLASQSQSHGSQLQPHLASEDPTPWARDVYLQALSVLGDGDSQPSSGNENEELTISIPTNAGCCGLTHKWRPKRPGVLRRLVRKSNRSCDECGCALSRQKKWMNCAGCKRWVCETCWVARTDDVDGSPTARSKRFLIGAWSKGDPGGASFGSAVAKHQTCSRGHDLEYLRGQDFRPGAKCRQCGTRELGATFPFFASCRLCKYDICPLCLH